MSKDRHSYYPVRSIEAPYTGLGGAMSGVPCVLLELGGPRYLSLDEIESRVRSCQQRTANLKWVAIVGDDRFADNELNLRMQVSCQLLRYIETTSLMPMGLVRLPLWDHVAIRVRLPMAEWKLRTELFHSVVVCGPCSLEHLRQFSENALDQLRVAFNGPRFVEGPGAVALVNAMGRNWRVSNPVPQEERHVVRVPKAS